MKTLYFFVLGVLLTQTGCGFDWWINQDKLVSEQQERMNRYPIPPDVSTPPPPNAFRCRMSLLPAGRNIDNNGDHDFNAELGHAEHCAGQLTSGASRPIVKEVSSFNNNTVIAYIYMNFVPSHLESPQNYSEYRAQFFRYANDHFEPATQELIYRPTKDFRPHVVWSGNINSNENQFLLVCEQAIACTQ